MSDPNEQTVKEYLFGPCSEGVLADKVSDGSDYWSRVDEFISDNLYRPMQELSYAQRNWLIKIKEALLE